MTLPIFLAAAAAAAQPVAPHATVNLEQARAAGYAQAQQALAGVGAVPVAAPQAAVRFAPAPGSPIAAPLMTARSCGSERKCRCRLSQELTTKGKKLRVGDRFHLETSEPVMVQGVNVIPVGSPAVGEITDVRNKGMWGKSGHLAARILYVTVNGRQIRLSGAFDDKGVAGGVGASLVSGDRVPARRFLHDRNEREGAGGHDRQELRRRGRATVDAGRGASADAGGCAGSADDRPGCGAGGGATALGVGNGGSANECTVTGIP